ncbi:hypothetical protein [Enterocloster bolteae]|jgi:hypothetical protein|uniref:hypothetical protein n=1 Tax=Enterocloster bolteae TaxID=208479 RepID=UPI001362E6F1|nr:hypothetical protein [Enterocloster bolteae]
MKSPIFTAAKAAVAIFAAVFAAFPIESSFLFTPPTDFSSELCILPPISSASSYVVLFADFRHLLCYVQEIFQRKARKEIYPGISCHRQVNGRFLYVFS